MQIDTMNEPAAPGLIKRWTGRAEKERLKSFARALGYDATHWVRVVPYREITSYIDQLDPTRLDCLEISAGHVWQKLPFRSFREMNYPDYDICRDTLDEQFDLIIADNVFEHLAYPYRAGRNVYSMLKPGGRFIVLTPFLVRIHAIPLDCSRWTETGLFHFLEECGFPGDGIETASWGNRSCVKANFTRWRRRGFFGSLRNEPQFPCQVWAFAQKGES